MGYYTDYKLTVWDKDGDEVDKSYPVYSELEKTFRQVFEVNKKYTYNPFRDLLYGENLKWYDHEVDMKKVALQFPDYTFELEGLGEDGYMWIKGWHGDKFVFKGVEKPCLDSNWWEE